MHSGDNSVFFVPMWASVWCVSLSISVVHVVEYQPGKWLWWCQLTPHCHPRFVRQTHLTKPLGHLPLFLPTRYHSPTCPLSSLNPHVPFFFYLYCDVFSAFFYCAPTVSFGFQQRINDDHDINYSKYSFVMSCKTFLDSSFMVFQLHTVTISSENHTKYHKNEW